MAEEGWLLLAADYSQVELRVLAHFSGDEAFVTAFESGVDVHKQTAAVIFEVAVDAVTPRDAGSSQDDQLRDDLWSG